LVVTGGAKNPFTRKGNTYSLKIGKNWGAGEKKNSFTGCGGKSWRKKPPGRD